MIKQPSNIKVGRRKTAVARVKLIPGKGNYIINDKDALQYLKSEDFLKDTLLPLKVTNTEGMFDISVNVFGGGVRGQTEAIRLGIARSLVAINPDYRPILREKGYLTRDPRMVERKKYGRPKARKRFQFSKR
ncbi:MAG: 30S ribosomal protein S9 [Ignavibacteria bacterium]|nr:30S ribosomal protein S9 [Ignavibacteria bacterium]